MSSSNNTCSVLILFFFFSLLVLDSVSALTSSSSCPSKCGEIEIPYPFGVREGCYLHKVYKIECKTISRKQVPFLSVSNKEVVNISFSRQNQDESMSEASLLIKSPLTSSNEEQLGSLRNSQLFHAKHYALLELNWSFQTTNLSFIDSLGCQNRLEYTKLLRAGTDGNISCTCEKRNDSGLIDASCGCTEGYRGNPYLLDGCKDIDECQEYNGYGKSQYCGTGTCENIPGSYQCTFEFSLWLAPGGIIIIVIGVLILIGVGVCLYMCIRRRKHINRKKKFFKRNGGLLLQQQLTSTQGNVETTKVFTSKELAKATEKFSEKRVLGQGGQGTVYKGMLIDGRIVAVKKSKVVDEDKLEEFINEVVILSQINHRNIVKLLGCCLETEVPLLVYEFISNGNLFEHLHDESPDQTMMATTWEMRLRIAIEISGALSYLHSAASTPIYHRDIKTTNIMLDEKYRAKVSDFGTSRSVTEDHTHLTTLVSGTAGYLDPEYFQSSQFTDKSDVYSFGVVLVELITGEKPISFLRSQENRTLVTYFNLAMKENRVVDIIDARIRDNCKLEQVMAVAKVARRCLNLKRKKRPNMRQVSMELEMIRSSPEDMQTHEYVSENEEEKEEEGVEVNIEIDSRNHVAVTSPASQYNVAASSSSWSDVEPLFPSQTQ